MTDDRQAQYQWQNEMEKLFTDKPFLFDHGNPFVPLGDYFRHFSWQSPVLFSQYACPWHYKPVVLDQFKGKIAWTNSIASPDGRTFMTVVQVDRDFHLVCTYGYSRDGDCLGISVEILATDPKRIIEFVKKNVEHRIHLRPNGTGFNLPMPAPGVFRP